MWSSTQVLGAHRISPALKQWEFLAFLLLPVFVSRIMSSNRRACFRISNARIFDPLCLFLFVMRLLSSIFISFTVVCNL